MKVATISTESSELAIARTMRLPLIMPDRRQAGCSCRKHVSLR